MKKGRKKRSFWQNCFFSLSLCGEACVMPETKNNRKIYSLQEISSGISRAIQRAFPDYYWIKAEIAKLNFYPKSGHCYPDLVEKQNGLVKAQIRANIWAGNYRTIQQKFKAVTGEPLKDGLKVLFLARVNYHEHYGLALNILDVEPSFTLGEMAREKQQTIERLKQEGLFEENKKRQLPLLPKRVAVISVETSKGYSDFKNVLENNAWHYRFRLTLFPALLQGDGAVASITSQLKSIAEIRQAFDVVAIIRGGGGDVGLNAYDNYHLAKAVALCPLPVIAGIGHSTNLTVVQMVAFANKITPTEAGHFLIQQFHNFSVRLENAKSRIRQLATDKVDSEKQHFLRLSNLFAIHTRNLFSHHKMHWIYLVKRLEQAGGGLLEKEKEKLKNKASHLKYH
ncbi:MAG TPA: exodeoxyribonuclease VII large subunit, partial [Bacteroidetes bacterium]|nr:exodeoxyribonuclease VII large subunit [Bacteroidota bacterium]